MRKKQLVEKALSAMRESRHVEFKREFDPADAQARCEIVKDIVALANSGGGVIVFGVNDDGEPVESELKPVWQIDPADIANTVERYTGHHLEEFEIIRHGEGKSARPAFFVGPSDIPIVFTKPGTYAIAGGGQRTAFAQGTVYFRHGAKSEPGRREDLAQWHQRALATARKGWLGNIRKVVDAPPGANVVIRATSEGPRFARITDDPNAPRFLPDKVDEYFPYRQKELIDTVNAALKGRQLTSHDVTCIKRLDSVRDNPKYFYKPHKLASPQYSREFANWIIANVGRGDDFLIEARQKYRASAPKPVAKKPKKRQRETLKD